MPTETTPATLDGDTTPLLNAPQQTLHQANAAYVRASRSGNRSARMHALWMRATAEDQLGHSDAAIASLTEALALSAGAEFDTMRLSLLYQLADRLYTIGHYREALEHWMSCIEQAITLGDLTTYVQAYMAIGSVFDAAGDHERGLIQHERALDYSTSLSEPHIYVDVRLYLASDYLRFKRYDEALALLDEADWMIAQHALPTHRAETCLHRGVALLALGNIQAGLTCLREGARTAEQAFHAWAQTMCLLRLGQALLQQGEHLPGERILNSALVLAQSSGLTRQQHEAQLTLATFFEATDRPRDALQALRAAHALEIELARHAPPPAMEPQWLKRLDKLDARLRLVLSDRENLRLRETQSDQDALVQRLHLEAYHDALTGLANRRWLDAQLADKLAHWQSTPPLSLLLLDIDHFKAINDDFSHLVGDAALRQVASLLQQTCRNHDTPVRFGGEEFVVLLDGLALADATHVAQRILQCALEHDWHGLFGERALTLSAGVAEAMAGDSADTLLARADAALYRAKHSGRNRVEVALAPPGAATAPNAT